MTNSKTFSDNCIDDKKMQTLTFLLFMQTLTATHIKILVYTKLSMRTAYAALQDMTQMNYIEFHMFGNGRGIGNSDRLYFLTKKGFEVLKTNSNEHFYKPQNPFTLSYYNHRKKILDVWVVLIMETKKLYKTYQLISCIPEWKTFFENPVVMYGNILNEEDFSIRPDTCFILKNVQTHREALFFLEVDTGSESITSKKYPCIQQKIDRYSAVFREQGFQNISDGFKKFPGARVLIVTETKKRVINMLKTLEIDESLRGAFLFSTHKELWWHGVLMGRYAKVGCGEAVGVNSQIKQDI